MSEQSKTPNPFELLLEQIRAVVREEIVAANLNGNGNGHSPALLSAEAAAKCFGVPKTWISEAARRGEPPTEAENANLRKLVDQEKPAQDSRNRRRA